MGRTVCSLNKHRVPFNIQNIPSHWGPVPTLLACATLIFLLAAAAELKVCLLANFIT